jgi:hypothetical protein
LEPERSGARRSQYWNEMLGNTLNAISSIIPLFHYSTIQYIQHSLLNMTTPIGHGCLLQLGTCLQRGFACGY